MNVEYSIETLRLGRLGFYEHYDRYPDEAELLEYIESLLKLGLALIQ